MKGSGSTHIFRTVFVLSALLASTACQRPGEGAPPSSTASANEASGFRAPLPTLDLAQMQLPELKCRDPQSCPPAVGELVAFTFHGPSNCTATLVAPRIVLTASHCVPWENLSPERRFTGNCWIRWPERPSAAGAPPRKPEVIPCGRLLSATQLGPETSKRLYRDSAFIELESPQNEREPMRIERPDKADRIQGSSALLYGIRPQNNSHVIELQNCERDDGLTVPELEMNGAGAVIFPSCRVLHGFSGGPIVHPNSRKIIAVISGVVNFDAKNPDRPLISIGTTLTEGAWHLLQKPRAGRTAGAHQ